MKMNNSKIAIVGGGPAGLTLARLLQQGGCNVTVYERDAGRHIRQQGATLDLHLDSGLKALQAAGLLDAFKLAYRPGADKLRITDHNAHIHFDDHTDKAEDDFSHEHFRPEIDRGPLRDILMDSLKPGTIVWDAQFQSMSPQGAGWTLLCKNGLTAYADLVIACDGANSRIRSYVTDIRPIYSGITVLEGNIYNAAKNAPHLNTLLNGGKLFALGTEKSIILSSKGDGSLSFYTGTREDEGWLQQSGIDYSDGKQLRAWFAGRFNDWAACWYELFQAADTYYIPRPMYHYPLDQTWTTLPNLTMIGDAAHRMPPYAGEGVNMAMLDALELAEALLSDQFPDILSALDHAKQQMCQRAAAVTEITLNQTAALHAPHAIDNLLAMFSGATQAPD
jgi:2-polyprenyl-6-methoxyphenol hydroxylase-like FAD-dependent oxidoreductase